MTTPRRGGVNPLFYYGAVEAAARAGKGTAEIWQAIRSAAEASGLESPGVNAAQVSRLRGQAGAVLRSEREFAKSEGSYRIEGTQVGLAPWARPWAQREAVAMYQVRFQHTTMGPDGPETSWRTVMFTGGIPATKDALLTAVTEDAQQMADKYGIEHIGIGTVGILEI